MSQDLYPFPVEDLPDDLPDDHELDELRNYYERGLAPITGFIPHGRDGVFCVVLVDREGDHHCHRYIRRLSGWDVSLDRQAVSKIDAFEWIAAPHA